MSRFASAAHLVSWAKFCPQIHASAGKKKNKAAERATVGWPAPWATSPPWPPAPTVKAVTGVAICRDDLELTRSRERSQAELAQIGSDRGTTLISQNRRGP